MTPAERFLDGLREDTAETARDGEHGGIRLSALTTVLLKRLEESGHFDDAQVAFYSRQAANLHAELHGYNYDSDDDVLSLFYVIDANAAAGLDGTWDVAPVSAAEVQRGFARLQSFVRLAMAGPLVDLDESRPAADAAMLVVEARQQERPIEYHVVTTGAVSDRAAIVERTDGDSKDVWDVVRLTRACGVEHEDSPSFDFRETFGRTLPCLVTPATNEGLQVFLTCIPGEILAKIYHTYRSQVLERNVRSFLQFTGKVNKGIRETVRNSPDRFLPYNNGLSATASEVRYDMVSDNLATIVGVRDFQIVNGGQTTATIAACLRQDRADLSNVLVPMKLTVVPPDRIDSVVPLISRYANTQNKVQEADYSANDPWHIGLERLSRSTWTPATPTAPRGTRWFYERSRGQYAVALAAEATASARRQFRLENPPRQRITKTDVAKYALSWDELPHIVSLGAQKCFAAFSKELLNQHRPEPDAFEFQRVVGQGILFRMVEKLYGELGFQGYRANVVTYTVARLSVEVERQLPWEEFWKSQSIPPRLERALRIVIQGVRSVIFSEDRSTRNISEWSKRPECWNRVKALQLDVDLSEYIARAPSTGDQAAATAAPTQLQIACLAVPAEVWFRTSKWAKEAAVLQGWQRSIAYSVGRVIARSATPSDKQAKQAVILLAEALRAGFYDEALGTNSAREIAALAKELGR